MKKETLKVLLALGWGAYAGAGVSYFITKRRIRRGAYDIIDAEVQSVKDTYARRFKQDLYETPEKASETFREIAEAAKKEEWFKAEKHREAVRKILNSEEYTPDEDEDEDVPEYLEPRDDLDLEGPKEHPFDPHVITYDQFYDGAEEFETLTLTYYDEDGVLVDERDKPVEDPSKILGDEALTSFGLYSKDLRVVHVQDNTKRLRYEVLLEDGSYTETVLGIRDRKVSRGSRFMEDD